jgi:Fic family protein
VAQAPSAHVWQHPTWPAFAFDDALVALAIANARRMQAQALERVHAIGFVPSDPTGRAALEPEAIATAAIEGEKARPRRRAVHLLTQIVQHSSGTALALSLDNTFVQHEADDVDASANGMLF